MKWDTGSYELNLLTKRRVEKIFWREIWLSFAEIMLYEQISDTIRIVLFDLQFQLG